MADWTAPATFVAVGTGFTVFTTYIVYKARIEQTRTRVLTLERELALARIREEINQKSSRKFFRPWSNCARRRTTSLVNLGRSLINSSPIASVKETVPQLKLLNPEFTGFTNGKFPIPPSFARALGPERLC